MEILSLILEIRFSKNASLIVDDKRQKLVELIVGEPPKDKPPDAPKIGMVLNDSKTKTRIVVEENRIAISVEQPDIDKAKKRLVEILKIVYDQIGYKDLPVLRIGVRTQWVCPWNDSFTSLLNHFKNIFYTDNSLLKEASDVGIALTFNDGEAKVNYSCGPMKPTQGKTFLVFNDGQLPHDFTFIDVDRYKTEDQKTFDPTSIKMYITDSISYEKSRAEETKNFLMS